MYSKKLCQQINMLHSNLYLNRRSSNPAQVELHKMPLKHLQNPHQGTWAAGNILAPAATNWKILPQHQNNEKELKNPHLMHSLETINVASDLYDQNS